jgi:hypothetical protein
MYNCKNEELPVICDFLLYSVRRDAVDFAGYSPEFNALFIQGFSQEIAAASELVNPVFETAELKHITRKLYKTMDGLIESANRLKGYIELANGAVPLSEKDFGLAVLRHKIRGRDAEGVLAALRVVHENIAQYHEPLAAKGLTEDLIRSFTGALTAIHDGNQMQYEILCRRKTLVQDNTQAMNDLYGRLMRILEAGKILYKAHDQQKLEEYTFSSLRKRVRIVHKPTAGKA